MNSKSVFATLFLSLAILVIASVAYFQNQSRSVPDESDRLVNFREIRLPSPILTINGQTQTGSLGTYCWIDLDRGVGICADTGGVPTLSKPLATRMETGSPILLHFQLADLAPIAGLALYAIPVTPNDELTGTTGSDLRWWPLLETSTQHLLTPAHDAEIELTLEPGLYVFNLFVIWEGLGDGSFGFLVKVH